MTGIIHATTMAIAVYTIDGVDIMDRMVKKEYDVEPLLLLRNATFFWGEKKCEHD
jgi:hypothetical protein